MPINETVVVEVSREEVIRRMTEYLSEHELAGADVNAVASALMAFVELPQPERKVFLDAIDALVCRVCGRPSCLCGYGDA